MKDRQSLLDKLRHPDDENIPIRTYIFMLLLMVVVILVLFPSVYIKNMIYYKSVEINKLQKIHKHLTRENKILKIKYNRLYFKNNIQIPLIDKYELSK